MTRQRPPPLFAFTAQKNAGLIKLILVLLVIVYRGFGASISKGISNKVKVLKQEFKAC